MRRFVPYFKYLRSVRLPLVVGILFGILSGLSSGAGIPVLAKIVPAMFLPDPQPIPVAAPASSSMWHFLNLHGLLSGLHGAGPAAATAGAAPVAILPPPPPRQLSNLEVWGIALWLPTIFLIRGVAGYLSTYLIQSAGVRILEQIRVDYFRKLQTLPLDFFQRFSTGEIITRGLGDTNQLQNTLTVIANDLVQQPATLIGAIFVAGYLAYREQGVNFVLFTLMLVPLSVFPIRYVGKKLVQRAVHLQAQTGSITDRFTENLAGIKEVRAFGLEAYEISRFARLSRVLVEAQMKVVKYAQALSPSIEIISAVGISITLVYAYRHSVHVGAFLAILAAIYTCYTPIKRLGAVNNELKRGEASLLRLEEILNEPVTIADPPHPAVIGRLRGDLAFDQVTFGYKPNTPVLSEVNIRIPAGTVCALVGPSGAGKTTFANLVPRFYDVQAGVVTIDGTDLRKMRFADLRSNIALVSQDPVLFNDTIYQNLLLGRPDATREEVMAAAVSAHAHEFIVGFPQGYDTLAGERGSRLSGGQKQRLAVARAFLRNAPILILDEATSALDSESEAAIQAALKQLVVGKTVLIIAHRFSTIRDASLILVFDQGRIVASGTHVALYAANLLYRTLYDRQHAGHG